MTKPQPTQPSVNQLTAAMVAALVDDAPALRLGIEQLPTGATIVDAGIKFAGGIEAGRRIAEICMGGLGRVSLRGDNKAAQWLWQVDVYSSHPVLSCLASQYAGWSLQAGDGKRAFQAMGSGPARAIGSREPLFDELGYRDSAPQSVLVLEVDRYPPDAVVQKVADYCGLPPQALTLILTPTTCLSGCTQVVARVLEVALHKAHELGFPLGDIVDGAGSAPLCPPSLDFLTAMGRTNDAIIFAGQVHLYVDADDADSEALAQELPSATSSDFGRPFAEIFKQYDYDFYKVDKLLFSPARVAVTSVRTGHTHSFGRVELDLLDASFSR